MNGRDILLGVNIDHVATLRQARGGRSPDPLLAALRSREDYQALVRDLERQARAEAGPE